MSIKITYSDEQTGSILAERVITDEQIKALSTDMISSVPEVVFLDWHDNAIQNKARQMMDEICDAALGVGSEKADPLSDNLKQTVATKLQQAGIIIPPPIKQWPVALKKEIIKLATVHTAAERQTEP